MGEAKPPIQPEQSRKDSIIIMNAMIRLGSHWLCCGDRDNYDDVYEAITRTYSDHFISILGGSLAVGRGLWQYRNKKYTGNGKAYPKAREYSDRWNRLAKKDVWIKADEVEVLTGIIEDCSKEQDVIINCWDFAVETLIACEVTGRVAMIMEKSPKNCVSLRNKWRAFKSQGVE